MQKLRGLKMYYVHALTLKMDDGTDKGHLLLTEQASMLTESEIIIKVQPEHKNVKSVAYQFLMKHSAYQQIME